MKYTYITSILKTLNAHRRLINSYILALRISKADYLVKVICSYMYTVDFRQ